MVGLGKHGLGLISSLIGQGKYFKSLFKVVELELAVVVVELYDYPFVLLRFLWSGRSG